MLFIRFIKEQRVTVSGVASMVPDGELAAIELIAASDKALYEAKHTGRNRVQLALNIETAYREQGALTLS